MLDIYYLPAAKHTTHYPQNFFSQNLKIAESQRPPKIGISSGLRSFELTDFEKDVLNGCNYTIYQDNVFPAIQLDINDCYKVAKKIIVYAKNKAIDLDKDIWDEAIKQFQENGYLKPVEVAELISLLQNQQQPIISPFLPYEIIENYEPSYLVRPLR